jgi:hypothetical protein
LWWRREGGGETLSKSVSVKSEILGPSFIYILIHYFYFREILSFREGVLSVSWKGVTSLKTAKRALHSFASKCTHPAVQDGEGRGKVRSPECVRSAGHMYEGMTVDLIRSRHEMSATTTEMRGAIACSSVPGAGGIQEARKEKAVSGRRRPVHTVRCDRLQWCFPSLFLSLPCHRAPYADQREHS